MDYFVYAGFANDKGVQPIVPHIVLLLLFCLNIFLAGLMLTNIIAF
jgi:hypothetical protein